MMDSSSRRWSMTLAAGFGLLVGCSSADGAQSRSGSQDATTPVSPQAGAPSTNGATLADTTLARLVDEILPRVERSAGVRAVAPLNVAATDEARLKAYLTGQLTTQLTVEEAAAITASYARLGLVPDTLDLRSLLLELLQEQVVGYYDPLTDTLFVHERVTVAQLEPVLAHELVHALQDQHVSLDSLARSVKASNDRSTASQAAIEGHATFAMMEWLAGADADLTQFPDLGAILGEVDLSAMGDVGPVEVLTSAPAIVREGMLFPYVGGLVFVQRMWKERPGRPIPFGRDLPQSTEQVLHLDRWMAGDEPATVRFTEPAGAGWGIVYERDLGELETRIFLEEHLGDKDRAGDAAGGWDGDRFRLYRGAAGEVLAWISAWDSGEDADAFALAAEEAYDRRYAGERRHPSIVRETLGGRPIVRILDMPAGVEALPFFGAADVHGGSDTERAAGGA